MKARIKLIENIAMMAEASSGHAIVVDGAPEVGGRNLGVRPMELILMGLGSCSAIDVIDILRKQRHQITDCIVEITGERREEFPKVFTKIHLHYIVTGQDLTDAHVKRAIQLSADKYCSVSAMLNKTAEITHDYEMITGGDNAEPKTLLV